MEPLKNLYNSIFFKEFEENVLKINPHADFKMFWKLVVQKDWEELTLKQRTSQFANHLHILVAKDFKEACQQILDLIKLLQSQNIKKELEYLFLPEYVALHGMKDFEHSFYMFENITEFTTCEFAIRFFIKENKDYALAKLKEWTFHENEHVRRLASEGSRPRLPWGFALTDFKNDPRPMLPLLENMIEDESAYVRKSVANHLNDISKDHPDILINFTEKHIGNTEHTDWILKHANRSLLKESHPKAMALFGFGNQKHLDVQNFKLQKDVVQLGEDLYFSFDLINNSKIEEKIRLEYAVYYLKKNGSLSKKMFKISEKNYQPFSRTTIERKQHFKPISTRVYHFGIHQISVIANGKEFDVFDFQLIGA